MRCEAVQEAVSEAMDHGRGLSEYQREHVRSCSACGQYQDRAWRLRELVRLELAPSVPDLVPSIMERVRDEAATRPPVRRILPRRPRSRQGSRSWVAAVAAALVVGLVAGFVLASGGVVSPPPENVAALAAEIPLQLQRAAVQLESYQAVFDVTELNWARAVPRRTFVAEVSFRAPESFRVQVRDTTDYPSEVWPRNDESLVTDGDSFRATGPNPCPAAALPACPQPVPVTREVIDRAPFDPRSSAPTDIVVPMTVLAASDRVDVRSAGQVAGHDAVTVQLLYQDAGSLFQYLRFLGSWPPFFPEHRVLLWLDRTTW